MNQQHFATYGHPSATQQQQQMYAAAARTNSGYGSQFASVGRTASMSAGGALPPISTWTPPSPQEHQYYDVLFAVADEEKRNAIGGRLAVMFFSRSNADKQILREVRLYLVSVVAIAPHAARLCGRRSGTSQTRSSAASSRATSSTSRCA